MELDCGHTSIGRRVCLMKDPSDNKPFMKSVTGSIGKLEHEHAGGEAEYAFEQ